MTHRRKLWCSKTGSIHSQSFQERFTICIKPTLSDVSSRDNTNGASGLQSPDAPCAVLCEGIPAAFRWGPDFPLCYNFVFMVPRAIRKILAMALPFYLLLQFVGCLSVCAWEVAEYHNESFASVTETCADANSSTCSIENLPKLTASERVPKELQIAVVSAVQTVHPPLPVANLDISSRPLQRSHFSPPIRRPLVLRI